VTIEYLKCHTKNPDAEKFCRECGALLKPDYAETKTLRPSSKDSVAGEIISDKYKLLEELGKGRSFYSRTDRIF
jgi:hypothetical protein